MPNTTCGRCGRLSHMTEATGEMTVELEAGGVATERAFKCDNCGRLSLFAHIQRKLRGPNAGRLYVSNEWLPRHTDRREFPDVPEHIAAAAQEATMCLSVKAHRAAGSIARAVIEATAKDKDAGGRNLAERIDALCDAGHVRVHTRDQAHEVRYFGNDMAHGDFVDPISEEEAEEIIELMSEVLDEVFQSPARLARRRQARLDKQAES